jgi:hypothetical protein
VNGISDRGSEIDLLQIRVVKYCTREITVRKCRLRKITFRKINFLKIASREKRLFERHLKERTVGQIAIFKIHLQPHWIGIFKVQPQHFAVGELHLSKSYAVDVA